MRGTHKDKRKNLSRGLACPAFLTGQKVKHNGLLFIVRSSDSEVGADHPLVKTRHERSCYSFKGEGVGVHSV